MMKRAVYSLFILLLFVGCSKKKASHEAKPIPIQAARSKSKDVPYYISTVGHMEAYEVVNLMAQVNGQLVETYFVDGADVKQGQLLYLIDQPSYIADLEKVEGELEENLANLRFAEQTAERNAKLVKDKYISQNDYDSLITNVIVGDAAVKQSRADVDNAKINLGYTKIYSPLDARAGESKIRDGNLILENGETTLVTLNKITPIYSVFYINEKDLPTVQRYQAKFQNLKVYVTVDDKNTPTFEGELTFIDNRIDISTGMIKLKGTHPNENKILWPNEYVKIKLILDTFENAVIVPFESVQTSPNGKYLYVVKGNKTVERRNVTVGQMQEDNTIVITKGIKPGEKVVTVGQLNLYPGAKVSIAQAEDDE
ncbi:MAG: efflux RND transporter periplasmic adaptor subunit [Candidatus Neptunochlamydia sp.]|nr:efflux RND transporter periplasmic adaptor subunit [Candidatus Neptunochlamydia sp.]